MCINIMYPCPPRYQIAVIILIYLLPLLVMLVTYSLIGQTLWGSKIPGEASDHYQNQIQAKRKVHTPTHTHMHRLFVHSVAAQPPHYQGSLQYIDIVLCW